ncbi:MAG: TIGR02757 family protein [Epsilonproteobacteria bacterium]|nr:TIGR02757 family protein [Campylobacterota bacterium]
MDKNSIKELLEKEIKKRDTKEELSYDKPDPLIVAKRYNDEYIALIAALFAYGNAKLIVKFLDSLDFSLLDESEEKIKKELKNHYYRFQKPQDVVDIFLTIKRLKEIDSIENIVYEGYKKEGSLLDGLWNLISTIRGLNSKSSHGFDFFFLKPAKKIAGAGTYKRYFMYFRWMVREDNLDMGLWKRINKKDLIVPLDTHLFNVSRKLGLLQRKSYDLKAALELTDTLKEFDRDDPLKYDFAIYRLGQEGLLK